MRFFKIKPASNGYILVTESGTTVYSFEVDSEVQAFAKLLRDIETEAGPTTSRYDAERIYVEVKPGDKHND